MYDVRMVYVKSYVLTRNFMAEKDNSFHCNNWCPARCIYQHDKEESAIREIIERITFSTYRNKIIPVVPFIVIVLVVMGPTHNDLHM